jgi:hypothetical protein
MGTGHGKGRSVLMGVAHGTFCRFRISLFYTYSYIFISIHVARLGATSFGGSGRVIACALFREGEAPAEPKLARTNRLGRSLTLPFRVAYDCLWGKRGRCRAVEGAKENKGGARACYTQSARTAARAAGSSRGEFCKSSECIDLRRESAARPGAIGDVTAEVTTEGASHGLASAGDL